MSGIDSKYNLNYTLNFQSYFIVLFNYMLLY